MEKDKRLQELLAEQRQVCENIIKNLTDDVFRRLSISVTWKFEDGFYEFDKTTFVGTMLSKFTVKEFVEFQNYLLNTKLIDIFYCATRNIYLIKPNFKCN